MRKLFFFCLITFFVLTQFSYAFSQSSSKTQTGSNFYFYYNKISYCVHLDRSNYSYLYVLPYKDKLLCTDGDAWNNKEFNFEKGMSSVDINDKLEPEGMTLDELELEIAQILTRTGYFSYYNDESNNPETSCYSFFNDAETTYIACDLGTVAVLNKSDDKPILATSKFDYKVNPEILEAGFSNLAPLVIGLAIVAGYYIYSKGGFNHAAWSTTTNYASAFARGFSQKVSLNNATSFMSRVNHTKFDSFSKNTFGMPTQKNIMELVKSNLQSPKIITDLYYETKMNFFKAISSKSDPKKIKTIFDDLLQLKSFAESMLANLSSANQSCENICSQIVREFETFQRLSIASTTH